MPDRRIYSFYHVTADRFKSSDMEEKFDAWIAPLKQAQISAVSFLTGVLYIIYSQLDGLVAPAEILPIMTTVHLYTIAPVLFLIALLSYIKKFSTLTVVLLIVAPVGAAIGNLSIVAHLQEKATYLTELYLILFWTFTVSGLRLKQATISATATFVIVLVTTYFLFPLPKELFIMHVFWMFSAFAFGLLGAYILEKSDRRVFLNYELLERLAITDELTGLYNRTKLDEFLQNELNRSQRFGHTFGMVVLDIDHFKNINDSYGHQVGDEILAGMAQMIKEHLRSTDKAVRWGGEEFIIIYLETSHDELIKLAEELRQKIEEHRFKTVGNVTASFGVTLYQKRDSVASIIRRADKALYMAKESGRNCVKFL
jgi:diguanylate cyclase (GGDEF)-like protein